MTDSGRHEDAELDARLRELTTWTGGAPALWTRALARAAEPPRGAESVWRRPLSVKWLSVLGVAAVLVLVVSVMLPAMGKARYSRRTASLAPSNSVVEEFSRSYKMIPSESAQPRATPDAAVTPMQSRQVIRRATLELVCADVRGAFLKAQMVVHAAGGEYVEDSALTGSGPGTQANLTLRVAADRLGEVLNELRPLGKVTGEHQGGEDVTAQAVDLDARLRNERRVEEELLQLLASREDADLKDVLELRQRIAEVRGSIEQLTGQQQRLSRMVSLATVLVLIRPEDARTETAGLLGPQVGETFASAWRGGLRFTFDTLAWLLRVAVGGIVWWVLLAVGLIVIRHRSVRAARLRGELA